MNIFLMKEQSLKAYIVTYNLIVYLLIFFVLILIFFCINTRKSVVEPFDH